MSRDVRNFTIPITCITRIASTGAVQATSKYTNEVAVQARDDSMSTTPKNGVYITPTDYWGYFFYGSGSPFKFEYYAGVSKRTFEGISPANLYSVQLDSFYGVDGAHLPVVPAAVQSVTAAQIQNRIKQSEFNFGQDIAEINESVQFILDLLKFITDMFKSFRSGNPNSIMNLVRTVIRKTDGSTENGLARYLRRNKKKLLRESAKGTSQAWLAYKFAWLPLLQSIYTTIEALKTGLNTRSPIFTVRASNPLLLNEPTPRTGSKVLSKKWTQKGSFQMEIAYTVSNNFLDALTRFGLTNPLAIAWELLPLSFVLDWFIPIRGFLASLTQPWGLRYLHGYQRSYQRWYLDCTWLPSGRQVFAAGSFPQWNGGIMSFHRQILLSFPSPLPHFRGLGNLSEDVGRYTSLFALAVQRLT